jgi:hypothetical protein
MAGRSDGPDWPLTRAEPPHRDGQPPAAAAPDEVRSIQQISNSKCGAYQPNRNELQQGVWRASTSDEVLLNSSRTRARHLPMQHTEAK